MSRDKTSPDAVPRAALDFSGLDLAPKKTKPSPTPATETIPAPQPPLAEAPAAPSPRPARPAAKARTTVTAATERSDPAISAAVAMSAGFTPRSPETKIDGRSLRRKGRSEQLNVKVTPELKARVLERTYDQGYEAVADYLEYLLALDDRARAGEGDA